MRLHLGRPRTALIVAPHADDETIGAFGLMRALARHGTVLRVLVVTDGCASHPASPRWPPRRLARARRRETLRAMRGLGVTASEVRFLDLSDGNLPAEHAACRHRVTKAVRRIAQLDLLVGPASDDDHADHRSVAAALAATRLSSTRRLTYKVWPIGRPPRRAARLTLDTATVAAKRRTIRGYRTQTGAITDDPDGFHMTPRQVAAFGGPVEHFRTVRP